MSVCLSFRWTSVIWNLWNNRLNARYLPVIVKWQPNHRVNPIGCQSVQLVYASYGKSAPISRAPQRMCRAWWQRSTAEIRHYPDSISDVMDRENLDLRYRPTPLLRDSHPPSLQLQVKQNKNKEPKLWTHSHTILSYENRFTFNISFVSSALKHIISGWFTYSCKCRLRLAHVPWWSDAADMPIWDSFCQPFHRQQPHTWLHCLTSSDSFLSFSVVLLW